MIEGEPMFRGGNLSEYLQNEVAAIDERVRNLPSETFQTSDDGQIVAKLATGVRLAELQVDFSNPRRASAPAQVRVHDTFSGMVTIDGLRATKSFPFQGDENLLYLRPSSWGGVPHARVEGRAIVITYEGRADQEAVKREFAQHESHLKDNVNWVNQEIERHNEMLPRLLLEAVKRRRQNLESVRNITDF